MCLCKPSILAFRDGRQIRKFLIFRFEEHLHVPHHYTDHNRLSAISVGLRQLCTEARTANSHIVLSSLIVTALATFTGIADLSRLYLAASVYRFMTCTVF